MKNLLKIFGIFAFLFLGANSIVAQDEEVVFEETKETTKFQRSYFPPRDAGWWTLGINGGWAYQSSDVPTTFQGYGFGMTLAKNLYYQPGSPISFDARGRWLYSQSIGLDTKRSTGLENNDALNGSREAGEGLDYTAPSGPGYVFQNNKTHQFELGLEGVITANRLRENTGIIASLYGGINLDWYNVKLDQADNGGIYDYSGIDNVNESKSQIKNILKNNIRDGVYETNAHGFEDGAGKIGFMPSLGVELGYQFTPRFSMHAGHKLTFPLSDDLDGELWKDDNNLTGTNDLHHYTNLGLQWIIDPGTNTLEPPIINVTYPGTNPYVSNISSGRVDAKIKNVKNKNDVRCYVNGNPSSFSFNKGKFRTNFPLEYGNNEILITATNQAGSDEETIIIYYGDGGGSGPPVVNNNYAPQVNITNPRSERYTSENQDFTIQANIKYVNGKNDIEYRVNGQNDYNFNYDGRSDQFSANIRLNEGRNEIEIIARNQTGSARDNVVIIYERKADLPRVNITAPARSPYETDLRNVSVQAVLENVTSKNDVRFYVNGRERSLFNYNSRSGRFNVDLELVNGRNEVTIKGSNEAGEAQDETTIIYKTNTPTVQLPRVNITQPNQNYSEVTVDRTTIQAVLENVTSKNDVRFYVNGTQNNSFNFDSRAGRFSASTNLREGQNKIIVKGYNQAGEAQDEVTIVYKRNNTPTMDPPVVTITSVSSGTSNPMDPNSQLCRTTVVATILNVMRKSDIVFRINGKQRTDFTYDLNSKVFKSTLTLDNGNNSISVKAFNDVGDDEDTANKNCELSSSNPPEVTINNPTNNSTSSSATTNLNARVKKVQKKSDVTVKVNGNTLSSFSFSPVSGVVTASINLKNGNNTISVFGKNNDGTDEASVRVKYNAPNNPPTVDITQPSNNATTDTKTAVVKAKILNINSKNDIRFTFNGSNTSNFSYSTSSKILTANVSLKEGTNTITVKATTADGTDSKTVRVKYIVAKNPPTVDITQPSNNSTTDTKTAVVKAKILNVNSKNDIRLTFNGSNTSNFSYSTSSKILTANVSLKEGTNTIVVKATTADGTDSETVRVKYNAPKVLPTVKITSPKNNSKAKVETVTVKANIKNVDSKSNITFLLNGKRVSNFILRGTQLSAQVKLKEGSNTIKINVKNSDGNDSDQVNVTYKKKVVVIAKPSIKFTNPKRPGRKARVQKTTVKAALVNVTKKNQVKVTFNGKNVDFTFDIRKKEISIPASLKAGTNTFIVKATNEGGTASAETSLKYTPRVALERKPVITITSVSTPTANPFNPNISGSTVIGNILNVSKKDQIKITHNGKEITDFTFNTRTKVFQVSISLANGAENKVKIIATNDGGTDTKEHTY
ncbi:MAG: hypothetical protein AB8H03_03470 [Saprospiraceae bacterium]